MSDATWKSVAGGYKDCAQTFRLEKLAYRKLLEEEQAKKRGPTAAEERLVEAGLRDPIELTVLRLAAAAVREERQPKPRFVLMPNGSVDDTLYPFSLVSGDGSLESKLAIGRIATAALNAAHERGEI